MQLYIFLMHIEMHIEGAWNAHSSCISVAFFLMHLQCTLEVQNSSQILDVFFITEVGVDVLVSRLGCAVIIVIDVGVASEREIRVES